MEWNPIEIARCARLMTEISAGAQSRSAAFGHRELIVRLSDAPDLSAGLPIPRTAGALFIRHLLNVMGFDETHVTQWRMEHKLVQALVLDRCCPGLMPVTRGLHGYLAGLKPGAARERLEQLRREHVVLKPSLSEGSGELGRTNHFDAIIEALKSGEAGRGSDGESAHAAPSLLSDEPYVLQEYLQLDREYRVHSLEDRVVPGLTFRRYAAGATRCNEREAPEAFVQSVLARLPAPLVRESLYGWDVALERNGQWRLIELNPTGFHPVFKRGFHCSGFFQAPPWGPALAARLVRFLEHRYGWRVRIIVDDRQRDDMAREASAYWWTAQCAAVLNDTDRDPADDGSPASDDGLVPERTDPERSPEQNLFEWALRELRRVEQGTTSRRAPSQEPESRSGQPPAFHQREDDRPVPAERSHASFTRSDEYRLREWNDTGRRYPEDACAHTLFQRRVREQPDALAIVSDSGALTYDALNRQANRLAHYLRAIGSGPETLIGVCMRRTADLPCALLAILKAGGAYLPLPSDGPRERMRRLAQQARVTLVLTDRHSREQASATGVTTLDLDEFRASRYPDTDPDLRTHPENLAYAISTSGSTGRPKLVTVRHAGLSNFLRHMREMLDIGADDRWLALTPLTFDIAMLDLFLPLVTGAQVWLSASTDHGDGHALLRRLNASRATFMQATPMSWRLLMDAGWTGDPDLRAISGGEPLTPILARQLATRAGVAWNFYGPTETTIWSSTWIVDAAAAAVPIGRPIANTGFYVLDEQLRHQPPGVPGELFITGDGLARGYFGEGGVTADRFLADPYATRPGLRMYRTGDWGRWVDGTLECMGRKDYQVKIHGVRIECGEIESVLAEHPGVREAAVVACAGARDQKRLVAFVSKTANAGADADTPFDTFLGTRLPVVMIPSRFVVLDRLPRTAHGKVDKRELESRGAEPRDQPQPFAAPSTATEVAIAAIWSDMLGVAEIGVDDDFVDIGGDSVSAIQSINGICDLFGVVLPMTILFDEATTIRRLAALVDELRAQAHSPSEVMS